MSILGVDLAREQPDNTCLCFQFKNTCLEEMKELWKIGDEYTIPECNYQRLGINKDSKLIISAIYENKSKDVFMNMLIR